MLEVPPSVSHTWDTLFPFLKIQSLVKQGEKKKLFLKNHQSLGDPRISCFSQVCEKICWRNISLDLHIRTAVMTDKKPYIDILMLGFFDRTM